MLKQQLVTYLDWCSKRCKSDVPDYTTTIILEKQDERSIRRNRKIGVPKKFFIKKSFYTKEKNFPLKEK